MKKLLGMLSICLLMVSAARATTYTWSGQGGSRWSYTNWTTTATGTTNVNLVGGNDVDLIFTDTSNDSANMYNSYTLRSLTFDDTIDASYTIGVQRSATRYRYMTLESDTGTSTITVESGADGLILFGGTKIQLNNDLEIYHYGTSNLTFNLQFTDQDDEDNGISIYGGGSVIFGGTNTYSGDTAIYNGTLTLTDDDQLYFQIQDAANNSIYGDGEGDGVLDLYGDFYFDVTDVTDATVEVGDSWMIVDLDSLIVTFEDTFSVVDFTDAGDGVTWTYDDDGIVYEFSEDTGILTVVSIPEPATLGLLGLGAAGMLVYRRRRMK